MINKFSFLLIIFALYTLSCTKQDRLLELAELPLCIRQTIMQPIVLDYGATYVSEVYKWTIDSETFYYINYTTIHDNGNLYTEDCQFICNPFGSSGWSTGIMCDDLLINQQVEEELIWTKQD